MLRVDYLSVSKISFYPSKGPLALNQHYVLSKIHAVEIYSLMAHVDSDQSSLDHFVLSDAYSSHDGVYLRRTT